MSDASEIIRLKLEKAHGLLSEVEPLMELEFYTTVISRLYYSCFHATTALLLTKGITAKTHKGVANMLHHKFVNTSEFEPGKAAFFGDLVKERIRDDYNEFLIMDREEVVDSSSHLKIISFMLSNLIENYFDKSVNEN